MVRAGAAPGAASGALGERCIAVYGLRERVRAAVRAAFPKRRARVVAVRTAAELGRVLRSELVDAVLVDLGAATGDAWAAAAQARAFPSAPFVAAGPLRASDGEVLARCVTLGFADVLVDGVDDAAVRGVVGPLLFGARFATAFAEPPPSLALAAPLQRAAWDGIVEARGALTRTAPLAQALGVTREHLSRSFGAGGPSLKGLIDLVRLLVAAELLRGPGYQVRDVAAVLSFASPSHLARASARVLGRPPSALAGATNAELLAGFVSRASGRERRGGSPRPAPYGVRGVGAGAGASTS